MGQVKFINKRNLQIARENVGLDTLIASKKISTSKIDLVSKWENGDSLPTWSQVNKLSKLYGVPELLFFSDESIQKNKIIPDYRVGPEQGDEEKIKKLTNLVIRRQKWLERKLQTEGIPKNNLQGSGKNIQSPEALANFIRDGLDISLNQIKEISGVSARRKTLKYLIQKAESRYIFVGKTISYHKISVEEMRGLFISNDYCPYIILNRKDALSAQIFSFVHELAHLFRKTDAISNSLDFRQSNSISSEEIFCNKVAAELLMPKKEFTQEFYGKSDIDKLSELYKVSKLSLFYRLKDLDKISKNEKDSLESEIQEETQKNILQKNARNKKEGGSYINNMKDSNGNLFNNIISNAYLENKISYLEASKLLKFSVERYE